MDGSEVKYNNIVLQIMNALVQCKCMILLLKITSPFIMACIMYKDVPSERIHGQFGIGR
jgi:hypothetical protein